MSNVGLEAAEASEAEVGARQIPMPESRLITFQVKTVCNRIFLAHFSLKNSSEWKVSKGFCYQHT
jgi:hypothetical protein